MADSVRERIMKNVQAALQAITVANGYSVTLNSVDRILQQGQTLSPPMAILAEGTDDVVSGGPLSGANGLIARELTVAVRLVVQQDTDSDSRSASEVLNGVLADAQKKMQEDYSRGGLAVNTEEVGVEPIQMEEGVPVIYLDAMFKIHYRHSRVDPTIAG